MAVISRTIASTISRVAGRQPFWILTSLSQLLGWIYTLAWSLSFYPQVIHNYTHRSTVGLSTDFVFLNALGHTSYLVYNALLYLYEPVRRAYRKTHSGRDNVVQFNDLIFSLHAALLALITLAQYLVYKKPNQHVSRSVQLSLAATLTVVVLLAGARRLKLVSWLDIVACASTIKLGVTLTKYLPQIKLNRDRQSTDGFAIENVLLDLTGGVLSLAQLIIDAVWIQHSWSDVTGDWGKLGLALLSIAFDIILTWQHYALYAHPHLDHEHHHHVDPDQVHYTHPAYASTSSNTTSSPPSNDENATESSSLLG